MSDEEDFDYEAFEAQMQAEDSDEEDEQEDSKLLQLVQENDWREALIRLASHPEEAVSKGIQGRMPLHVACDQDAPCWVVKALLEASPASSAMVGTSGMTPLHISCSSQHACVHVVRTLLEGGQGIETSMRDVDGDTPLAAACRCGAPKEVLETLLRANPSAVHIRDHEGLTPLLRLWVRYYVILESDRIEGVQEPGDVTGELWEAWEKTELLLRAAHLGSLEGPSPNLNAHGGALSGQQSPALTFRAVHAASAVDCPRAAVVRIATILYPNQVMEKDEQGNLPLAIAAVAPVFKAKDLSGSGYSLEDRVHGDDIEARESNDMRQEGNAAQPSVIEILLDASRDAAFVTDQSGRLPFHLAVASGKGWNDGLRALLDANPYAFARPDPVTGLSAFMLAATPAGSECNTIFELLRMNPELIRGGTEELS